MESSRGIVMKTTVFRFVGAVLFLLGMQQAGYSQSSFDTCSAEGSAVRSDVRALNRKKNRDGFPTDAQINRAITFSALMSAGEFPRSFAEGDAAEIVAYCADVKIGSVESVNCKAKDHWHRDTHIELTLDPNDSQNPTKILVVEVTPRFRQAMKERGIDWSQQALRDRFLGRWVKVRGWVFYDALHADESAGSGNEKIWRGSPWEIHPVTDMSVTTRPAVLPSAGPAEDAQPSPLPSKTTRPSNDVATQCQGITTKGSRCQRMTKDPSGFCYQHQR